MNSKLERKFYEVIPVRDNRPSPEGFVQFAVVGHDGFEFNGNLAGYKNQIVLFSTQLDGWDGGQAECDSWITGFNARRGPTVPTFVSSMGA